MLLACDNTCMNHDLEAMAVVKTRIVTYLEPLLGQTLWGRSL